MSSDVTASASGRPATGPKEASHGSAYLTMVGVFAASTVLGIFLRWTWFIVVLGAAAPLASALSTLGEKPVTADTLLFISPFLVVMAVLYAAVALAGALFGRFMARKLFSAPPRATAQK